MRGKSIHRENTRTESSRQVKYLAYDRETYVDEKKIEDQQLYK